MGLHCCFILHLMFLFFHQVDDEESLSMSTKNKKEPSNEVVEAPKAEGYYCIEYNMFPDEPEPTKVDLVMFGLAAKVYMTNETKVNYIYVD